MKLKIRLWSISNNALSVWSWNILAEVQFTNAYNSRLYGVALLGRKMPRLLLKIWKVSSAGILKPLSKFFSYTLYTCYV